MFVFTPYKASNFREALQFLLVPMNKIRIVVYFVDYVWFFDNLDGIGL